MLVEGSEAISSEPQPTGGQETCLKLRLMKDYPGYHSVSLSNKEQQQILVQLPTRA
jgi:hypothetical protein